MPHLIVAVVAMLIGYEWLYRSDTKKWRRISDLELVLRDFEHLESYWSSKMVLEFKGRDQWLVIEFATRNKSAELCLGLPRVDFSECDYGRLQAAFLAEGFEFRVDDESSRFFARVPVVSNEPFLSRSGAAARAIHVFMKALEMDLSVRFRRGWE